MCITLLSTGHPKYCLVLLSNRDEFIDRPTSKLAAWELPYSHIFSGRDLARPEHGTWLGITRHGRLAVLTNVRESAATAAESSQSRGAIVTSFLIGDSTQSVQEWLKQTEKPDGQGNFSAVGGFSLLCGTIRNREIGDGKTLAILSNRTSTMVASTNLDNHTRNDNRIDYEQKEDGLYWLEGQAESGIPLTLGLSNSLHRNPWPKVHNGLDALSHVIKANLSNTDESQLIEALFEVLSKDSMPIIEKGSSLEAYYVALTQSVFIPKFVSSTPDASQNKPAKMYGTTQQSIILVDTDGRVTYVERTLFDENGMPMPPRIRDTKLSFQIEGWEST